MARNNDRRTKWEDRQTITGKEISAYRLGHRERLSIVINCAKSRALQIFPDDPKREKSYKVTVKIEEI